MTICPLMPSKQWDEDEGGPVKAGPSLLANGGLPNPTLEDETDIAKRRKGR